MLRDMDALLVNAGSWASISGAAISTIGLIATIIVAWGARSASRAARAAAIATNNSIERHLQAVDVERAIGLIQRIKLLHDTGRWEAAMEQYQALRMMLSDIMARCSEDQTETRQGLAAARADIRYLEDSVRESIGNAIDASARARFNRRLNNVQSVLEELASAMGFGDQLGEAK